MPHCILEYSSNIADTPNSSSIFKQIHKGLVDTGLFELYDIKSRTIVHDVFFIGDGNKDRAFVTLSVQILSGRDAKTKQMISNNCLKILENFFPNSLKNLKFSLTVQIYEIDKDSYARIKTY